MFYWIIYLFCSFCFSHFIAIKYEKYYYYLLVILLTFLVTPAQTQLSSSDLSPAIFTFILNLLFEKELTLRPIRPLMISVPASIVLSALFIFFKKRFFLEKDY